MEQLQPWWLQYLRPVFKYIVHKLTGQTEIQRVSRASDLPALQKSIMLSKQLGGYKQRHCLWQQPYNPDLAKQLCAIKRINNLDAQFRVAHLLQELHSWKYAIHCIQAISKTKYDSQSPAHQTLLLEIWTELRPGREIKARKSNEWIQLGFQGDDPATDFRGSGMLGLLNLNGWVKTAKGKEVFEVASTPGTQYFFASASIFFTIFALELLKQNKITSNYWITDGPQTLQPLFQKLFQTVFIQFDSFWKTAEDKSMMQFNVNLIELTKHVRNNRIAEINQRLAHRE